MNVEFEETPDGWFYQLEDEAKQGPFTDQAAAEKDLHRRIAASLTDFTREILFGPFAYIKD